MDFKVGDKVVNINHNDKVLNIGKIYVVSKLTNDRGTGFIGLENVKSTDNNPLYFHPDCFMLHTEFRLKKIKTLKNNGY